MLKSVTLAAGLILASLGAVKAQTIGLATTQGGATEQLATNLAKAIAQGTDLKVRPQVLGNTSQYLPLVNSGRVEFGIANYPQTSNAVEGVGMSEGQPHPNLVMIASIIPFNAGLLVAEASGIKEMADLKGRKVPRFPKNSLGDIFVSASLATAGLTYNDVVSVPTANFPAQFQNMKDGVTELTIGSVGAQSTLEIEATLGKLHYLNFKEGDEKTLDKYLPGTLLKSWKGRPPAPGADDTTTILYYDYTLFAHKDVPASVVTKVVKALYESKDAFLAAGPLWAEYDPAKLAHVTSLPYHAAAVEFYKSVGIWKGE
jgi:TRAP transporter TAXI family solute receptor